MHWHYTGKSRGSAYFYNTVCVVSEQFSAKLFNLFSEMTVMSASCERYCAEQNQGMTKPCSGTSKLASFTF